jgi:hypothetical protein
MFVSAIYKAALPAFPIILRRRKGGKMRSKNVSGRGKRTEEVIASSPHAAETSVASAGDGSPEARARKKVRRLWQLGDLFHATYRYPRRPDAPRVDRLAGILRRGLVAPGCCEEGTVRSDLNIVATGFSVPYDSLIFLHRFEEISYLYTLCDPGRFTVFVDRDIPVRTPQDMGPNWVMLSQDEVYVPERIPREQLIGVAIHPADAASILRELQHEFRRLEIPLYEYDGTVLWPPR